MLQSEKQIGLDKDLHEKTTNNRSRSKQTNKQRLITVKRIFHALPFNLKRTVVNC